MSISSPAVAKEGSKAHAKRGAQREPASSRELRSLVLAQDSHQRQTLRNPGEHQTEDVTAPDDRRRRPRKATIGVRAFGDACPEAIGAAPYQGGVEGERDAETSQVECFSLDLTHSLL